MALDSPELFTVRQRLASSRRALMSRLHGDNHEYASGSGVDLEKQGGVISSFLSRSSYGLLAGNLMERWWNRHPANAAGQLARPLLEHYARHKPVKLLAISAGIGALVMLTKPWRLLSATALLAAFLKTSNVADMVTTLMEKKYGR